ncbi:MAG: PhoH family protein [Pseudomonadota bacterium]|nr:PhoH family protein [Pseudomonadota bacterium]
MTSASSSTVKSLILEFDDNSLLPQLFGAHNSNLARIEQILDVSLDSRGNSVKISGVNDVADTAQSVLNKLYQRLKSGYSIDIMEVDIFLNDMVNQTQRVPVISDFEANCINTRKRKIYPRLNKQTSYLKAIDSSDLVFGLGPAGTGKTYLAVAKGVECLLKGEVDKIILSRPAVEAGEQLGFLPGDMREKVDPYLRPVYDALNDMIPKNQVAKKIESGEIEIAPLAFMRGRTLGDSFIILDEAQNTTLVQMKMFLTRLGKNAKMVVTGDLSQIDLPRGVQSGLKDAVERLKAVHGISIVEFDDRDVVRHSLVAGIVKAYDKVKDREL